MLSGHEHHVVVAAAIFTGQEQSALRTVAAVMRSCAAGLPGYSLVGHQLFVESDRLQLLVDRQDHQPRLELVASARQERSPPL